MLNYLLKAPRATKRLITLCYDAVIIPIAIYSALALRHGDLIIRLSNESLLAIASTTAISLLVLMVVR